MDLWELSTSSKESIIKELKEPSEGVVGGDALAPLNFVVSLPCRLTCLGMKEDNVSVILVCSSYNGCIWGRVPMGRPLLKAI